MTKQECLIDCSKPIPTLLCNSWLGRGTKFCIQPLTTLDDEELDSKLALLAKYRERLSDTVKLWLGRPGELAFSLIERINGMGFKVLPTLNVYEYPGFFEGEECPELDHYTNFLRSTSREEIPYIMIGTRPKRWAMEVSIHSTEMLSNVLARFDDDTKSRVVFAPYDNFISWEVCHDRYDMLVLLREIGNPVFLFEGFWPVYDVPTDMPEHIRSRTNCFTIKRDWGQTREASRRYREYLSTTPLNFITGMGYREGAALHHFQRLRDAGYSGVFFLLPNGSLMSGEGDTPEAYMEDILTDVP